MHSSAFYEKCFRIAFVSVVVSTVGWGIYAVLSDNGFVPKVEHILADSEIAKTIHDLKKLF